VRTVKRARAQRRTTAYSEERRAVLALGLLLACCPCAFPLNPSLDINQYAHTAWTVHEGFFKGAINAIAQTPDGYLWLGTAFGLLRFDGVRSVPWQPPPGQRLPSIQIWSLLAARDGTLWIGSSAGLASWKNGKLTQYAELAGQKIFTLLDDRQGTTWAGGLGVPTGRLCAIQNGSVQCYGEDRSLGQGVLSLYEYRGDLWAGAATGLWRWKPDPPKLYPMPGPVPEIRALIEGDNGALWIALRGGIRQLVDGKAEAQPLPVGGRFSAYKLLRDREGGLWIGTSGQGLLHVHQGRTDVFASDDSLSGDYINSLFEDREGNIWAATGDGLDRFRDFAVPTISFKQGLSSAVVGSVLAARDGSVWLGASNGLNRWNDGQITIYRKRSGRLLRRSAQQRSVREVNDYGLPDSSVDSLFQDDRGRIWVSTLRGIAYFEDGGFIAVGSAPSGVVHSLAEESPGNLWINDQDHGLFHLLGGTVAERIPWARLGRKDYASALVPDRLQGGLWIGFLRGGAIYFKDGQVRSSYAVGNGLGEGRVNDFQFDQEGTLWAATDGGLSRLKNGRVATLTSQSGLPCDAVHWVMEDDAHSFWLYMTCGLARIARPELDAWAADPSHTIKTAIFDSSDGVRNKGTAGGYSPLVAKTADGKLWFVTYGGVSVIDPRHLPFNKLPPPVHIERIVADRKTHDATSDENGRVRLPPLIRDLEIDYTALSLVAQEKVRFRYKLEGWDRDWEDAGNRRQAFYTNLPPRNYRFRVSACNNSGVWNEAGAFLDFAVDPAYYQTTWFRLSCVGAFLALLGALYRLRLRYVAQRFNMRFEERLAERTRIAQELHDTLLQGFLSVSMQVHVAADSLPEDSQAKPILTRALQLLRQVIDEGRNAVRGLRSYGSLSLDLEQAFSLAPQELAAYAKTAEPIGFRVIVEGQQRPLHPLLRDDAYRIGREALVNAFHHSRAKNIEVELRYSPSQLCILVRDDGCGIDPHILESGRDGHWGLSGMRERAEKIGARLHLCSSASAGTEVELTIPASVAYVKSPVARRSMFSGKGT
jgi:signal transduction histidine kinase/ligand-binding sensor domain-containing protein